MPFDGRIPETNIVVDNCAARYDGCYFLITHPHTDHTKGLTSSFTKGAIHCSKLCKELLLMRYPSIQQHNPIIGHEIESSFTLSHLQSPERRGLKKKRYKNRNKNTYNSINSNSNNSNETDDIDSEDEWRNTESNGVQITLIDANHCPGSVMFLIKNTNGKIYLHTGDYRTSNEMCNNKLLTNVWIDIVYMDVTFCHPSSVFPSKKEIATQTINYIKTKKKDKQWRKKNNMSFKVIYIEAKQLGIEPFLVEMCKRLKTKMWVNSRSWQYKYLTHFKETKQYVTLDQSEALIHIPFNFHAFVKQDKQYRKENKLPNVLYISATTMYFVLRNWCNTRIKMDPEGILHVLYSMHSGYDEMRKFISKLNVKQVMPFHDPFMHQKWDNFDAVRYIRKHFEDCIENDPTESKDIFVPNLNSSCNSMDVDVNKTNKNKNTLMCMATALNKDAQNEKFLRLQKKIRQNKHKLTQNMDDKLTPTRMNTAPVSIGNRHGGKRGAKCQDGWIHSMTQIKNVKECNKISPPRIEKSVSDFSPILPRRNRKRKLNRINENENENDICKRRKIASHTNNKQRNTQYTSTPMCNMISSEVSTPIELMDGISCDSNSNNSPILSGTLSCEKRGISGKYKVSSPLKIPNLRSQYSDTFDGMDMDDTSIDDDGDDDAKMVILEDNGITPGNVDDESTINEGSEVQLNEQTWSSYKDRRPGFMSRVRVKGREYMIYKENKWDRNRLNELMDVMEILEMKRVYTVRDSKFIVVDLEVVNSENMKDDILYKLGWEYYNGDISVREVWNYKIFECVKRSDDEKQGILCKELNGELDDYFIMSSFNVDGEYLDSQGLWPMKQQINEYPNKKLG